jgi:hypothetical protein
MSFCSGLNAIELASFLTKENGTSCEVPSSKIIKYELALTAAILPNVLSSNFTLVPILNFFPIVIRKSSDSLRPFF